MSGMALLFTSVRSTNYRGQDTPQQYMLYLCVCVCVCQRGLCMHEEGSSADIILIKSLLLYFDHNTVQFVQTQKVPIPVVLGYVGI